MKSTPIHPDAAPGRPRNYTQLGAEVRAEREALGWTQADLAERAGLSKPGTISEVENGRKPSRDTFQSLVAALNAGRRQLDPSASSLTLRLVADARRTAPGSTPASLHGPGPEIDLTPLEGFWVEAISGDHRPYYSIGHFHRRLGRWHYDGWNESDGHGWQSLLFDVDTRHIRILYAFEHHRNGQERGDGFGAVQLRAGAQGIEPVRGWFVMIRGPRVTLHHYVYRRLADAMAEVGWTNPDMGDEENRRRFFAQLARRRGQGNRQKAPNARKARRTRPGRQGS